MFHHIHHHLVVCHQQVGSQIVHRPVLVVVTFPTCVLQVTPDRVLLAQLVRVDDEVSSSTPSHPTLMVFPPQHRAVLLEMHEATEDVSLDRV